MAGGNIKIHRELPGRPLLAEFGQLDLFHGPHIAAIALAAALTEDDLANALRHAEPEQRGALAALLAAASKPKGKSRLAALAALELPPDEISNARYRQMAMELQAKNPIGSYDGQPAGWYWRAGDREHEAIAALREHLTHAPLDANAWTLLAEYEPMRAGAIAAFVSGAVSAQTLDLMVDCEDELEPADWLIVYAWLQGHVSSDDLAALTAAAADAPLPVPLPGDGRAFVAWILVGDRDPSDVRVRRALQKIHAPTFKLWLARRAAMVGRFGV